MPKIRCYNIPKKTVLEVSTPLTKDLSTLLNIPNSRFSFLYMGNQSIIQEGKEVDPSPAITITWKERPEEVIIEVAKVVKKHLKEVGIKECPLYFENIFKKIK